MESNSKVFLFEEVADHNQKEDCWLIISGKVYDVTSFLDDHPGGDDILLTATGKDATEEFEDIGHSDDARQIMEKYYIGKIDLPSLPSKSKHTRHGPSAQQANAQGSSVVIKVLQFLVPLLMLVVAFYLKNLKKE